MDKDLHPVLFKDSDIPNEHQSLLRSCWSVGPLLRIPATLALKEVDKLLGYCKEQPQKSSTYLNKFSCSFYLI